MKKTLKVIIDILSCITLAAFVYLIARIEAFPHDVGHRRLSLLLFEGLPIEAFSMVWLTFRAANGRKSASGMFRFLNKINYTPRGVATRFVFAGIGGIVFVTFIHIFAFILKVI